LELVLGQILLPPKDGWKRITLVMERLQSPFSAIEAKDISLFFKLLIIKIKQ
jgi:hypothetical protein